MEIVKDAIDRDGIALARVSPALGMELSRFGGRDHIKMLKFRASCFPRDTSSWKILDVCVLSIVQQLDNRIRLAESIHGAGPELVVYENTEVNVFRDTLLTLIRRFWRSFMETNVFL
jgi:hypothetical protein